MIRIIQQRDKCIGCNACVEAAFHRWRMNRRDGKCALIGSVNKKGFHQVLVDDHELEENQRAAANCPVKIIQVLKL
jgi:ferredoxin